MTRKRADKKKPSLRTIILIAIISVIGIGANISYLSINLANKPKSTAHLCAPARHGPYGLIAEADLGCMLNDKKALNDWTAANYTYGILIILLIGVLIADGIAAYKIRKN
ncbi:MAG: hypothetical protein WAZ21_03505 [Candidatus Saccharimonadales bacterium]